MNSGFIEKQFGAQTESIAVDSGELLVDCTKILSMLSPDAPDFHKLDEMVRLRLELEAESDDRMPARVEYVKALLEKRKEELQLFLIGIDDVDTQFIDALGLKDESFEGILDTLLEELAEETKDLTLGDLIAQNEKIMARFAQEIKRAYANAVLAMHGINQSDILALLNGSEKEIQRLYTLAEALLLEIMRPYSSHLLAEAQAGKQTFIEDAEDVVTKMFAIRARIEEVLKEAGGNIPWATNNVPSFYFEMVTEYFRELAARQEQDLDGSDPEFRRLMEE